MMSRKPLGLCVSWITPIGLMHGTITDKGLETLCFPDQSQLITEWPFKNPVVELITEPKEKPLKLFAQKVEKALTVYFQDADPTFFKESDFDWRRATPFEISVWRVTRGTPTTTTYREVAFRIGNEKAARAVGNALGRNPIVLLTPCHRVVATSTHPQRMYGGFSGSGIELKKFLLKWEASISRPSF